MAHLHSNVEDFAGLTKHHCFLTYVHLTAENKKTFRTSSGSSGASDDTANGFYCLEKEEDAHFSPTQNGVKAGFGVACDECSVGGNPSAASRLRKWDRPLRTGGGGLGGLKLDAERQV